MDGRRRGAAGGTDTDFLGTTIDWGNAIGRASSDRLRTYYFRNSFVASAAGTPLHLVVRAKRDDGIIVRINGARFCVFLVVLVAWCTASHVSPSPSPSPSPFLPLALTAPGDVVFTDRVTPDADCSTLASSGTGSSSESRTYVQEVASAATIVPGAVHTIAVELHNRAAGDGDVSFDVEVDVVYATATGSVLKHVGDEWAWKYDGAAIDWRWKDPAFDTSAWPTGPSPFDMGNTVRTEHTDMPVIDTNPTASGTQRPITGYFVTTFEVADPTAFDWVYFFSARYLGISVSVLWWCPPLIHDV